jgi:tRNA-binding EMAP/Myf-like protein
VVGGSGDAPGGGWMEVLGSGMVNRKVIEFGGLDPDEWQGFAFGTGVDRPAMLKYGLDDLRAFFDGDARWLNHYGFAALDVPTLSAGVECGREVFLSWLKALLDTQASTVEIAEKLTALGLEIESVTDASAALQKFRVARVLTAEKHPQADKLQVLSVDLGDGSPLQVVCGAPNARAGLVGVLGLPGAVVPANGMELRKSAIRGVESNGMMCSTRELCLGEDHDGIIELPEDAPLGQSYADYIGSDPVFDVSITPNRPDCMGVHGIARDLAAAGIGTLRPLGVDAWSGGPARSPSASRTRRHAPPSAA